MIHQLDIYGKDKVQTAIERLQNLQLVFPKIKEEGYFLAFSGGKDSVVIKALADMSGVKYDAHYHLTSVDPPELVQFIKKEYPDVIIDIPRDKNGKQITMWSLIASKNMPPTRLARYCCRYLKESGGIGRVVVTGVRWAESSNRKNNQGLYTVIEKGKGSKEVAEIASETNANFRQTAKGGVVLNNDNEETRDIIEQCYTKHETVLNPIIDWDDSEVWEFIREYKIPYCKLYDEGFKRLGCIGCPMGGGKRQLEQFKRYPKYKQSYMRAFEKMLQHNKENNVKCSWNTPEDVFYWWIKKEKL